MARSVYSMSEPLRAVTLDTLRLRGLSWATDPKELTKTLRSLIPRHPSAAKPQLNSKQKTRITVGKVIPLQVRASAEVSTRLKLPDFKTSGHEGGKVFSSTNRPPLPPGNIPGTHCCGARGGAVG